MPVTSAAAEPVIDDAGLVAAYLTGDERSATELVARHAQAVSRFLWSSGAGQSDIDDLVQETFFRAFRKLDSWRGEASLRGWLYTIAGNLHRDAFRRSKGRQMLSIEDHDAASETGTPEHEFAATDAAERLRDGLGRLPRLQREVFLARAEGGLEYDAIARALGTTPGAARVHYHHAVKRLKEWLR
jgi:RNA polymerase sigma-70 factor (ECF subfamily)